MNPNPNANPPGVGYGAADSTVDRNTLADSRSSAIVAGSIQPNAHHPGDPRMVDRCRRSSTQQHADQQREGHRRQLARRRAICQAGVAPQYRISLNANQFGFTGCAVDAPVGAGLSTAGGSAVSGPPPPRGGRRLSRARCARLTPVSSKSVDVVVTGSVQGVFFRASCAEQAERLGVTGWIANRPDGSVAGHFEGSPEAVDSLVAWCHSGPRRAAVAAVSVDEADAQDHLGFDVR